MSLAVRLSESYPIGRLADMDMLITGRRGLVGTRGIRCAGKGRNASDSTVSTMGTGISMGVVPVNTCVDAEASAMACVDVTAPHCCTVYLGPIVCLDAWI